MNINDLLYNIHHINVNESEFIPLIKIKNMEQKFSLEEKGYNIEYTYNEWLVKYPLIATEHIFYIPNNISFGSCIYYDKLKYIFVPTIRYETQDKFRLAIKNFERLYQEKDFKRLLFLTGGTPSVFLLSKILIHETPSDKLYSAFITTYKAADFGAKLLTHDAIKNAVLGKSQKQKEKTQEKLNKLKDEIVIYRGMSDKSTNLERAFSWTIDVNVANFFATRLGDKDFIIVKATVQKKNVIEFIQSNEQELIVLPEHIIKPEFISLLSLDKIITEYSYYAYYQEYAGKICEIYLEIDSNDQRYKHTLRVLFMSLYITQTENIPLQYIKILCDAIAWHDIGKIHDEVGKNHGNHSYEMYMKKNGANKDVEFLITYHCLNYKKALIKLSEWETTDFDILKKLFHILKDADALDRVRFGIRSLDLNMLRLEISKKLTPIARELLNKNI